ncbi:MAG: hypothetical protein WAL12_29640, partial [Trebonia sp.]
MSETAERTVGQTGAPQGGPTGVGGAVRLLGRQREATVFVIAVALFLYFVIDKGSDFTSKTNQVLLWSDFTTPIIIIALGEV